MTLGEHAPVRPPSGLTFQLGDPAADPLRVELRVPGGMTFRELFTRIRYNFDDLLGLLGYQLPHLVTKS